MCLFLPGMLLLCETVCTGVFPHSDGPDSQLPGKCLTELCTARLCLFFCGVLSDWKMLKRGWESNSNRQWTPKIFKCLNYFHVERKGYRSPFIPVVLQLDPGMSEGPRGGLEVMYWAPGVPKNEPGLLFEYLGVLRFERSVRLKVLMLQCSFEGFPGLVSRSEYNNV